MNEFSAWPATAGSYDVGEGIIWDWRVGLIRWVDITRGLLFAGRLEGDRIVETGRHDFGQTVGAVALAEDGGLLVALARGLATVSTAGEVSVGPDILDRPDVRLNDGAVDPHGRFIVGTLRLAGESHDQELLRVSPDLSVEVLRGGLGLSNGVAFSRDGGTIYHVDSLAKTVSSHSYRTGEFDADEPWKVVLDDFPALPDGLVVDGDGMLWVALWGGGRVQRYAPTGELLAEVRVAASQASCPSFIGPDLDILAIATAAEGQEGLGDESGAIFLVRTGATGLPEPRWRGQTAFDYEETR